MIHKSLCVVFLRSVLERFWFFCIVCLPALRMTRGVSFQVTPFEVTMSQGGNVSVACCFKGDRNIEYANNLTFHVSILRKLIKRADYILCALHKRFQGDSMSWLIRCWQVAAVIAFVIMFRCRRVSPIPLPLFEEIVNTILAF